MNHAMSESEMEIMQKENAELRAQVNSLREAVEKARKSFAKHGNVHNEMLMEKALSATKEQSLSEHNKKVIAEFRAKCEVKAYAVANTDDENNRVGALYRYKQKAQEHIDDYVNSTLGNENMHVVELFTLPLEDK